MPRRYEQLPLHAPLLLPDRYSSSLRALVHVVSAITRARRRLPRPAGSGVVRTLPLRADPPSTCGPSLYVRTLPARQLRRSLTSELTHFSKKPLKGPFFFFGGGGGAAAGGVRSSTPNAFLTTASVACTARKSCNSRDSCNNRDRCNSRDSLNSRDSRGCAGSRPPLPDTARKHC